MNEKITILKKRTRYENGRAMLWVIMAVSVVDLLSIFLYHSYFIVSTQLTQTVAIYGYVAYMASEQVGVILLTWLLGLISLLPYFFCWLFSKRKLAPMIAALSLFAVDSVWFWIASMGRLVAGDLISWLNFVLRALFLIVLMLGVSGGVGRYGVSVFAKVKPRKKKKAEEGCSSGRSMTLFRVADRGIKRWKVICFLNNAELCVLRSGESKTLEVPRDAFELYVALPDGTYDVMNIAAGEESLSYRVDAHWATRSKAEILIRPNR